MQATAKRTVVQPSQADRKDRRRRFGGNGFSNDGTGRTARLDRAVVAWVAGDRSLGQDLTDIVGAIMRKHFGSEEDAIQDAWIRLLGDLHKIDLEKGHAGTWIYLYLYRRNMDRLRKLYRAEDDAKGLDAFMSARNPETSRRRALEKTVMVEGDEHVAFGEVFEPRDPAPGPLDLLIAREDAEERQRENIWQRRRRRRRSSTCSRRPRAYENGCSRP